MLAVAQSPSLAGVMMTATGAPALLNTAGGVATDIGGPMHADDTTRPSATTHGTTTSYRHGCRCDLCRAAKAAKDRAYYAAHRDNKKAQSAAYRAIHKADCVAYSVAYRAAHREERAAYRVAHKAEFTARQAAYDASRREEKAAYYAMHREEKAICHAAYNAAHKAERAAYSREYSRTHVLERRARCQKRRAKKLNAPGSHTATDVAAQLARQKGRCFWCHKKVGDSYHVDHVIPVALGGSDGPENIVIACPHCNMSKGAKHPTEFAGRLL